jgi:hypothetical protein
MTERRLSRPPTSLTPFYTTGHRGWDSIEHALHRRGNDWYAVFARGYGMASSRCTVFSQPTRGFGQRAPHLVSADFTLNFDPLYLNQYGSN